LNAFRVLPEPWYAAGRVVALLTRPVFLFLANNYLGRDAAEGLALAFLASGIGMAAIAADPHRDFYARHFGLDGVPIRRSYFVYLASLAMLGVVGCLIVGGIAARFSDSRVLVLCAVVYFVSEKLADEVLRFRLFDRDFSGWGRSALARSALQVLALATVGVLSPVGVPAWLMVLVLSAATFMVFIPHVPIPPTMLRRLLTPRTSRRLFAQAFLSLRMNWVLWAISLFATTVGYLDRLVALALSPALLPVFTLIVMAFSSVTTAVDFFFLSLHRRELLQRTITLRDLLGNRRFQLSVAGGLLVGGVGTAMILQLAVGAADFPLWYVATIAVVQTSMALSMTPQQILYWGRQFQSILYTETCFWAVIALGVLGVAVSDAPRDAIFIVVGCGLLLRLAAYVWQADRVIAAPRPHAWPA
jgi:hypothetical protein